MKQELRNALQNEFDEITDYANNLDESKYSNSDLRGINIGQVLLNLVCERERMLNILQQGDIREWSCSIDDESNKLQIMQALFHTAADILVWIDTNGLHDHHYRKLLKILVNESRSRGMLNMGD